MEKIPKYLLRTYGCAANEKDSENIKETLNSLGLEETKKVELADVLIINSCSVRQAAEDKVYGIGKKLKELKTAGKNKPSVVILTGCLVGSASGVRKRFPLEYIQKKIPWITYFLPPQDIEKLPDKLAEKDLLPKKPAGYITHLNNKGNKVRNKAYVNISTGCDNFCSYCVVPYARGPEISRTKNAILKEVRELASRGFEEITLLGQNVNSWGLSKKNKFSLRTGSPQKLPFAKLLKEIHRVEKIKKIGFLSSNPFDFTQDLIETLKLPKMSRYIHIAVQSGDDKILKKMNRRHTTKEFRDLVENIRENVPDIEIGTDLIVGFPGETEKQFMNTVNLCKKIGFNVAYISMYSERPGTTAQKLYKDSISLKEKKRRHTLLTKIVAKSKHG